MDPVLFVYKAVKDGALAKNAFPEIAEEEACVAKQRYMQNRFNKPSAMIADHIKLAINKSNKRREATA